MLKKLYYRSQDTLQQFYIEHRSWGIDDLYRESKTDEQLQELLNPLGSTVQERINEIFNLNARIMAFSERWRKEKSESEKVNLEKEIGMGRDSLKRLLKIEELMEAKAALERYKGDSNPRLCRINWKELCI